MVAPDFYRGDRKHLKLICQSLQALYEGRLIKTTVKPEWHIVDEPDKSWPGLQVCKKLMLNVPPQHGKTRTLINFSTWCFGRNPLEKVITGSYNDTTASDFSRYTRDALKMQHADEDGDDIVYSDIFPSTTIKKGNAGFEKWALDGAHFSYLGIGVGGSVTSKGGSILIVDDPVKSAEDALNENSLDRTWLWYTSTFGSRVSADKGEPIEIICMTRWSDQDICGRLLEAKGDQGKPIADQWFVIRLEAYDATTDQMLCPAMMSKQRYLDQRALVLPQIFRANYHQETMEKTGTLFRRDQLKRFSLAKHRAWVTEQKAAAAKSRSPFLQAKLGYADVADDGEDFYALALGDCYQKKVLITDVIYTADTVNVTMPLTVALLKREDPKYVRVESNNQGSVFIKWLRQQFSESKVLGVRNQQNKITRIMMAYMFIMEHFHFPEEAEIAHGSPMDLFIKNLCSFMQDGSSKHDDAPDCAAGLAVMCESFLPHLFK